MRGHGTQLARPQSNSESEFEFPTVNLAHYLYDVSEDAFLEQASHPIALAIVKSAMFSRLRKIRFLGAIDYLFQPNGQKGNIRHTRFDHTLGVGYLAYIAGNLMNLTHDELGIAISAALLHDIGHGPLSHSAEPAFKKLFSIDHHSATLDIVYGRAPYGPEVSDILRRHSIRPNDIEAAISGTLDSDVGRLFSSPINLDTIEGISRTYSYVNQAPVYPPPHKVVQALVCGGPSATQTLDSFWELKDSVYRTFIHNSTCYAADLLCQNYLLQNASSFARDDFALGEDGLMKKHRHLFAQLRYYRIHKLAALRKIFSHSDLKFEITRRSYFVDRSNDYRGFGTEAKRYKHQKWKKQISLDGLIPMDTLELLAAPDGDLPFDDDHFSQYRARPIIL